MRVLRFAKRIILLGMVLSLSAAGISWAGKRPPFQRSCLSGRYTMSATGIDLAVNNNPFALVAYINATCTGARQGTFTGQVYGTYPGSVTPPHLCQISGGTFTIDANSGAIHTTGTLGDVTSGSCAGFSAPLDEYGFLADPKGDAFDVVETGQYAEPNTPGTGAILIYHFVRYGKKGRSSGR